MPLGDPVNGHEPDIVPVPRILAARIAKTDNELHGRPIPLYSGLEQATIAL